MITHHTKGIVLRNVKYGETSLVVTIYTELFGVQSYLVNGVRASSKKGSGRANLFQPAAVLDMIVYHNELKNLQRIREFKLAQVYQNIFSDVLRNCIALFMVELLQKTIKQPESNEELYGFIEDAFLHLDHAALPVAANFPLFFALHLAGFFGFRISDDYDPEHSILDMQEGAFVKDIPHHPYFLAEPYSQLSAQFLKVMQPHELSEIRINHEKRRIMMQAIQQFYALHIPDFGIMKTIPVLQQILG